MAKEVCIQKGVERGVNNYVCVVWVVGWHELRGLIRGKELRG